MFDSYRFTFADLIEDFFRTIFSDFANVLTKMKYLLIMDPTTNRYADVGAENPFIEFWSGAGVGIQNSLIGIATVMCGVFFCVEFIKTLIKVEGTTYEMVLSVGFKFCLARLTISLGSTLMSALYYTGGSLIDKVYIIVGSSWYDDDYMESVYRHVYDSAKEFGVTEGFATLALLVLPLLGIKIITILAEIMAYGRLLELMMYFAFSPLPMGLVFIDNGRIPKRFFASFFAVVLQGLFMLISFSVFLSMIKNPLAEITLPDIGDPVSRVVILNSIFKILLAGILMVVIMMKSGQWASKMVGEG